MTEFGSTRVISLLREELVIVGGGGGSDGGGGGGKFEHAGTWETAEESVTQFPVAAPFVLCSS